jgi:hypothetical protein
MLESVPRFFSQYTRKIDWTKRIYLSNIVKFFQQRASPEDISTLMTWLVKKGMYVDEKIEFDWPPPFFDILYTPTEVAIRYGHLVNRDGHLVNRDELLKRGAEEDRQRVEKARQKHILYESKKQLDRDWLKRRGNYDSLAQKLGMRWYKHRLPGLDNYHYNKTSYPKDEDCPVKWTCLNCKSSRIRSYNRMFIEALPCQRCSRISKEALYAPRDSKTMLRIMKEQDEAFLKRELSIVGSKNLNTEDSVIPYHEPYVLNDRCTRELYDCHCIECQDKTLTGHKYKKTWYKEDLFEIPALISMTRKEKRIFQASRGLPGYLHITNTHIATAGRGRT